MTRAERLLCDLVIANSAVIAALVVAATLAIGLPLVAVAVGLDAVWARRWRS